MRNSFWTRFFWTQFWTRSFFFFTPCVTRFYFGLNFGLNFGLKFEFSKNIKTPSTHVKNITYENVLYSTISHHDIVKLKPHSNMTLGYTNMKVGAHNTTEP